MESLELKRKKLDKTSIKGVVKYVNDKALRVLEFNKIKEDLKKYTTTSAGKDIIESLVPYDNAFEVREHIEETKEAFELLIKKSAPPFEGLYDVREGIGRAQKGFSLCLCSFLELQIY